MSPDSVHQFKKLQNMTRWLLLSVLLSALHQICVAARNAGQGVDLMPKSGAYLHISPVWGFHQAAAAIGCPPARPHSFDGPWAAPGGPLPWGPSPTLTLAPTQRWLGPSGTGSWQLAHSGSIQLGLSVPHGLFLEIAGSAVRHAETEV